jgi:hypothetical protein
MKKTMFIVGVLFLGMNTYAQTESKTPVSTIETNNDDLFKSKKPADAQPATFSSQEDLDLKVSNKIKFIKEELIKNKNNPEQIKFLQEELWRFENAIVVNNKK